MRGSASISGSDFAHRRGEDEPISTNAKSQPHAESAGTRSDPAAHSVPARVAAAWSSEFQLELDRESMAFLAGIHAFLDLEPEPFLSGERLQDIFALVSELALGDPATLTQRATRAIARLREQHLLVRGDLSGISREGEYGLSSLGKTLAEWMSEQEALTRESLTTMMTRIRADLADALAAAKQEGDTAHWQQRVVAPLKFSVAGLMQMIDQRSRGLDREQENVRTRISELLDAGWFQAIGNCEAMLESVSGTLSELHQALMTETESASSLLSELHDRIDSARQTAAEEAVNYVRLQMDRVSLWGESRFRSWSDYYQNVHEFIRSVVRVDRDRALRTRLKDAIQSYADFRWGMNVVEPAPYRALREAEVIDDQPRVSRRALIHQHGLEAGVELPTLLELMLPQLQALLREAQTLDLVEILTTLAANFGDERKFALLSTLTPWLARQGRPTPWRQTQWQQVSPRLQLQNLTVRLTKRP